MNPLYINQLSISLFLSISLYLFIFLSLYLYLSIYLSISASCLPPLSSLMVYAAIFLSAGMLAFAAGIMWRDPGVSGDSFSAPCPNATAFNTGPCGFGTSGILGKLTSPA